MIVMHFIRVFYFSLLCLYIVQLLLVDILVLLFVHGLVIVQVQLHLVCL